MRLHPGLLTLENYQCDQRLRLYQPGNEDRLDEFLTTNEGRREIFQAFLFILHYSIVLNKYVLQDDQVMDLAVLEPFSPLDLAWLGYSKYECIKSDNPIRIGSTFTKIAWRNLLQTYLLR